MPAAAAAGPRAELSSVATALDDLVGRLTAIAEGAADGPDDPLAGELFEIERTLTQAQRRLSSLVDS